MNDFLRKFIKLGRLARMPGPRRALTRFGVAATTEHDYVLAGRRWDTIVDIGANRGQFSLAARHFHPNALIHAFEPLPTAAAVYRRVFVGDARTVLHEMAVSPVTGTARMHVAKREDSSSMLPITPSQTALFPTVVEVAITEVAAAPLAEVISADDLKGHSLLKIDVQGFELEVLKAVGDLLPRFEQAYVEASFEELYAGQALAHEIIDFMHAHGFRLEGLFNAAYNKRTGAMLQADLLFTMCNLSAPANART